MHATIRLNSEATAFVLHLLLMNLSACCVLVTAFHRKYATRYAFVLLRVVADSGSILSLFSHNTMCLSGLNSLGSLPLSLVVLMTFFCCGSAKKERHILQSWCWNVIGESSCTVMRLAGLTACSDHVAWWWAWMSCYFDGQETVFLSKKLANCSFRDRATFDLCDGSTFCRLSSWKLGHLSRHKPALRIKHEKDLDLGFCVYCSAYMLACLMRLRSLRCGIWFRLFFLCLAVSSQLSVPEKSDERVRPVKSFCARGLLGQRL